MDVNHGYIAMIDRALMLTKYSHTINGSCVNCLVFFTTDKLSIWPIGHLQPDGQYPVKRPVPFTIDNIPAISPCQRMGDMLT